MMNISSMFLFLKICSVVIVVLATNTGFSSGSNDMSNINKGVIYTDVGQAIKEYSFATKRWTDVLYDPTVIFSAIGKLNDEELVFSYYRQKIILKLNRHTGDFEIIGEGHHPLYIKDQSKLVFYRGVPGEARTALYIADYNHSLGSIEEIDQHPPVGIRTPILISDSEFLYASRRSGRHGVWRYNVVTSKSDHLPELRNCALWHAFWKQPTQQLLCAEIKDDGNSTRRFYMSGIDGKNKEYIDFGKGSFRPVLYIEEYDAIILQQRTSTLIPIKEIHPVWIYDMKTGNKTKIADNMPIGDAVWYSEFVTGIGELFGGDFVNLVHASSGGGSGYAK
ncbi:MAG: hypothetical protein GY694_22160 [Gammaproteobacteria bacterium]|nr:hypothetical protein [Gammaproteobacteria bacterium]